MWRVYANGVAALEGDAQDHDGHAQADEGIEDRGPRRNGEGAGNDGERDVCVDAGMIAVCDQRGAVEPASGAAAYQRGKPVTGETDCSSEREREQVARRGGMDEAHDRLI